LNALDTYSLPVGYIDLTYEDSKYYMAYNAGYDILDYIEDTLGENYTTSKSGVITVILL
jgi:hypothetical protein